MLSRPTTYEHRPLAGTGGPPKPGANFRRSPDVHCNTVEMEHPPQVSTRQQFRDAQDVQSEHRKFLLQQDNVFRATRTVQEDRHYPIFQTNTRPEMSAAASHC